MKLIFKCLIIFWAFSVFAFAQVAVVSEYFNVSGDPNGEWTEIMVVEDNVSLVGFTLRDNAGSTGEPVQWTGGVRFKNHPLWQNLRRGTIIVINHRYNTFQNVDIDKRDGYIEIDAENETYFEKRCFSCIVGPDWYEKALNIAQESDILQLIDQNDNHVHALAHMQNPAGSWLSLPSPKISYNGSIPRSGISVRVCPGRSISAYAKGFDNRNEDVEASLDYVTKGKPNNRSSAVDVNQLLWRELRQPDWNSPVLNAVVFADSVAISWNQVGDPYPNDSLTGYLIVRVPKNQLNQSSHPVDGKVYQVGENIGSGVVVAVINYSQTTRFVDRFQIPCGESFVYRIYAFRFRADDFREDTREVFARGRQYNERNFGEVTVQKPALATPIISSEDSKLKICRGDSVLVAIENLQSFNNVKFEWFLDERLLLYENKSFIYANESGTYKVKVTDTMKCSAFSNSLVLTVLDYPEINLFINSKLVTEDTTIVVCANDSIELSVKGWFSYKWFNNGVLIFEGKESKLIPKTDGKYFVESSNDICTARTPTVEIRFQTLKAQISPNPIVINLDKYTSFKDTIVTYVNLSEDTIVIDRFIINAEGFEILSPSFPVIVPQKSQISIQLRFKADKVAKSQGIILFFKNCNLIDTLFVEGNKSESKIIASPYIVDFGFVPNCFAVAEDSSLKIYNNGNGAVQIIRCELDSPFFVIQPNFPINLNSNDSISFVVGILTDELGVFRAKMKLIFTDGNLFDTLWIDVLAKVFEPKVSTRLLENLPITAWVCDTTGVLKLIFENHSPAKIQIDVFETSKFIKIVSSLPFTLDSLGKYELKFQVIGNALGNFYGLIKYKISPCDIIDSVNFPVQILGVEEITSLPRKINLGSFNLCQGDTISIPFDFIFEFKGGNTDSTSINLLPSDFDITLQRKASQEILPSNFVIRQNDTLTGTINVSNEGTYKGNLYFLLNTLNECNKIDSIQVEFVVQKLNLNLSKQAINFGVVEISSKVFDTIIIENRNAYPISINKIENVSPPFGIKGSLNFPLVLLPNERLEIVFSFLPTEVGLFENEIYISYENCKVPKTLRLQGVGIEYGTEQIILRAPNFKKKPFDKVSIPITFAPTNGDSIFIKNISFDFMYNPRLLNITDVSVRDKRLGSFVVNTFGNIKINLYSTDGIYLRGTDLVSFSGEVYLGDEKATDLKLENVNVSGNQVYTVKVINGMLALDSVCALDLRLVNFKTLPKVNYISTFEGNLVVNYSATADWYVHSIEIFNVLGERIGYLPQHFVSNGANSEVAINGTLLPNGFYIFVVNFVSKEGESYRATLPYFVE